MPAKLTLLAVACAVLMLLVAPATGGDGWVAKTDSAKPNPSKERRETTGLKLTAFQVPAAPPKPVPMEDPAEEPAPVDVGVPDDMRMPYDNAYVSEPYDSCESCSDCSGCSSYDACTSCAGPCTCRPWSLYAGYASVFAKPYFSDGVKYFRAEDRGQVDRSYFEAFDYDFELTPRVWVGIEGPCGGGVRARWWQFDHAGEPLGLVVPVGDDTTRVGAQLGSPWDGEEIYTRTGGEGLSVVSDLEVDTLDVELTQKFSLQCACVTASGGIRYARTEMGYRAEISDDGGLLQYVSADQLFEGIGPTVAVELRRPIGCRGWAVFADARGSVLFGDRHIDARRGDYDSQYSQFYFTREAEDVLGVGELEIGLEWSRRLMCNGALFFRGGYEGQLWHGAGSPSHISGDLGFHGLSIAVGITR